MASKKTKKTRKSPKAKTKKPKTKPKKKRAKLKTKRKAKTAKPKTRIKKAVRKSVTELKKELYGPTESTKSKEERKELLLQTVSYELAAVKVAVERLSNQLKVLTRSVEELKEEES